MAIRNRSNVGSLIQTSLGKNRSQIIQVQTIAQAGRLHRVLDRRDVSVTEIVTWNSGVQNTDSNRIGLVVVELNHLVAVFSFTSISIVHNRYLLLRLISDRRELLDDPAVRRQTGLQREEISRDLHFRPQRAAADLTALEFFVTGKGRHTDELFY